MKLIQHSDGRVAKTFGVLVVNDNSGDNRCRLIEYPSLTDAQNNTNGAYIWHDAPTLTDANDHDALAQAQAIVAFADGDYFGATIL